MSKSLTVAPCNYESTFVIYHRCPFLKGIWLFHLNDASFCPNWLKLQAISGGGRSFFTPLISVVLFFFEDPKTIHVRDIYLPARVRNVFCPSLNVTDQKSVQMDLVSFTIQSKVYLKLIFIKCVTWEW